MTGTGTGYGEYKDQEDRGGRLPGTEAHPEREGDIQTGSGVKKKKGPGNSAAADTNQPSVYTDPETVRRMESSKGWFGPRYAGHGVYWEKGKLTWISKEQGGVPTPEQADTIIRETARAGWTDIWVTKDREYEPHQQAFQVLGAAKQAILATNTDFRGDKLLVENVNLNPGRAPFAKVPLTTRIGEATEDYLRDLFTKASHGVSPRATRIHAHHKQMTAKERPGYTPLPS